MLYTLGVRCCTSPEMMMFYAKDDETGVSVCLEEMSNGRWLAVLRDDDAAAIVGTMAFPTLAQAQAWAEKATA